MPRKMELKVAVVQAGSLLFDGNASVDKAVRLIGEAGAAGAELILLPEAFVPGYPRGFSFGAVVGNRSPECRRLWQRYHDSAVEIPGPFAERLGRAAAAARAYVAVGVVERDAGRPGSLYCSLLYFAPDGRLLGRHRKLKPTASERLVWGEGDGSGLVVLDTEYGRVGGLICWENYMPLARAALYAQGVGIYLAPTADARDAWQASMVHVACEGRTFVLGCNQFVERSMYPEDLLDHPEIREPSRPPLPWRLRDRLAGRADPGGSALGSRGDAPRNPRSRGDRPQPLRFRPGRSLCPARRFPPGRGGTAGASLVPSPRRGVMETCAPAAIGTEGT